MKDGQLTPAHPLGCLGFIPSTSLTYFLDCFSRAGGSVYVLWHFLRGFS